MGQFGKGTPRRLVLRSPARGHEEAEDAFVWSATMAKGKWPEIGNLLGRLKRDADARFGEIEFGHAWLELLDRNTTMPWTPPADGLYVEQHTRLHLALRTNPACVLFAGTEAWHAAAGFLTVVNRRVPTSAANLGEYGRIHLVADVRKKDLPLTEE